MLTSTTGSTTHQDAQQSCSRNWFHSLPSERFQALLTLFPKFFSSFPHGTFLLSVSRLYLALEGVYLPFSAPLPKYATLRRNTVRPSLPLYGTLTLHGAFFQKDLNGDLDWWNYSRLQFESKALNFQVELFPVHSPLLRESCSFSFPPLTYMLKFSG